MNERQAKKVRKETRRYWQKYIARFSSLPVLERLKLAFAIVMLRSNTAYTGRAAGSVSAALSNPKNNSVSSVGHLARR